MAEADIHFETTSSGKLYGRHWDVEGEPRGVVLLVHGLAEHCGRYKPLAEHLNSVGFAVCAMDLPGHGKSPGTPGFVEDFGYYVEAVLALRKHIEDLYPNKPVFLLGHSMGGLTSTLTLIEHQGLFRGAVLSGAAIETPMQPPAWQLMLLPILSYLFPRVGMMQLDAAGVSRDPTVVEDYIADPLNYGGKISMRLASELFKSMNSVRERGSAITLPILILHGGADSMAAPEGAILLHDTVNSQDRAVNIYEGLYHEIFNEPEGPDIFSEVGNWLVEHCAE